MLYDFGEGKAAQNGTNYTYTKAGRYFITQFINVGDGAKTDGKYLIEVFEPETPQFTVEACGNYAVNIKITSNKMPRYIIDYGTGRRDTVVGLSSTSYAYTDDQPKTITVSSLVGTVSCGSSSKTVTPLRRLPAADFQRVRVIDDTQVELSFQQNSPFGYKVAELTTSDNATKTIALSSTTQTTLLLSNRNISFETYVYRLNPINCQGQDEQSTLSVGTMRLRVTTAPKQNVLTWNTLLFIGFEKYEIYRDNQLLATVSNPNQTTFTDTQVRCNQPYTYRVEYVMNGGRTRSISVNRSVTTSSYSEPSTITNFNASIENGFVTINVAVPNNTVIRDFLVEKNGVERKIPFKMPYIDNSINPAKESACYRVAYIDECGNMSEWSTKICNTVLNVKDSLNTVYFSWTGGSTNSSVIEIVDNQGKVINTLPLSPTLNADLLQQQVNRFRIRSNVGGQTVYSNTVMIALAANFTLPNAFSPNKDGLNDVFLPTGKFIQSYRMVILGQWGDILFESTDLQKGWEGTGLNGGEAPSGTYAYQIEYIEEAGGVNKLNGVVTVIR
jgi:gliding motility-associated-like protein